MQKQIQFKVKGMQRDLSASAFNPEYAYENKNIRIMPTDESTLLSIINEKGNKSSSIIGIGDNLVGTPIGQSLVNNELVVFTAGDKSLLSVSDIDAEGEEISDIIEERFTIDLDLDFDDRIYKLWFNEGKLNGKRLFRGQLGFDPHYPIEAISFYENSDIRKVYWTDKLNQPRVINIAAADYVINKWNSNSFDFVRKLKLQEEVTIERNIVANGTFAPGVIQYAFTYFNKYGQESNIFYTSPLYYISYNNRGASPEDKVGNSFNISIDNIDISFDYVRVYSIHRTSINATPTVKRVVDLAPIVGYTRYYVTELEKYASAEDIIVNIDIPLSSIEPDSTSSNTKLWKLQNSPYKSIKFPDKDSVIIKSNETIYVSITDNNVVTVHYPDWSEIAVNLYTKGKVSYIDNGTSGDIIDPTELLYVGGDEVLFGTMAQKDNTLFLGDINIKRKTLNSQIRNYFKKFKISFTSEEKELAHPDVGGYYPYDSQLKYNSDQIKTFKYLEWYRFGIQAQHYTGKWSEPIWLNDKQNNIHIDATFYENGAIKIPIAQASITDSNIIKSFIDNGYVRIRPVIVYPDINNRECICQGILCPTVYNVADRYTNSPFAQSSWFTRPNAPFDIDLAQNTQLENANFKGDWQSLASKSELVDSIEPSIVSRAGITTNDAQLSLKTASGTEVRTLPLIDKGAWAEFRHNYPIPDNKNRNAEIQCIVDPESYPTIASIKSESEVQDWVASNSMNYYVDQSIVTLHSPDIEFDTDIRSIDSSNLKLRIVGVVPLTSFISDVNIQTLTPPNNYINSGGTGYMSSSPVGFYKESMGVENYFDATFGTSYFGWRGLISAPLWMDEFTVADTSTVPQASRGKAKGFVVYPWHRNGSLNNTKFAKDGYKSALLDKKRMSNLRFSYKTFYLDNSNSNESSLATIWKPSNGISGVSIFDSNEQSLIKIPAPKNSNLGDITYYGNVDKILTPPLSNADGVYKGYPIIYTNSAQGVYIKEDLHKNFIDQYKDITALKLGDDYSYGIDPVRITYKSTPHAVLALNYTSGGSQVVLPTIKDYDPNKQDSSYPINSAYKNSSGVRLFWDKKMWLGVEQDILEFSPFRNSNGTGSFQHGFLWLGELYNDNVVNRFGGQTEEAFENNLWLPCGEAVKLLDTNGIKDNITLKWTEGDTYYQRYDHLKTYPFTPEDQNQMVDIVSFMCETRVNIDGRYDRNRGQINNFAVTPTNFNLINNVYSQQNNFFNYRTINLNKLNLDNFHNSITWTKTKTAGELIDTWTNITLASTLDLDGDKGDVRAIRRFNNNLIAFQDRGISQILYNENMQITSTEGVPIEIANSGKVNGKRYLSDKIGCANKWSMCETSNGIYFIDDITKGIFLFNGELNNLSDKLGFHSWINAKSTGINIWNPVDFNGFVTYYDKINRDVFFISKDECLAFSESLGQFTSFYSYEHTPYFTNLEDRGIALNTDKEGKVYKVWLHNEGEYNMFFNKYCPFYTTVIANPDMPLDKIFNNLEFRADSWYGSTLLNTTFDTLTTWNEYQTGTATLNSILGKPSELKRKFRIWRANIPRAKSNGRDRMRNPWLYIKLSMENENTNKTILHDMIVHYFE